MEEKRKQLIPGIIVHGGAWSIPDHLNIPYIEGVQQAARAGYEVLRKVSARGRGGLNIFPAPPPPIAPTSFNIDLFIYSNIIQ